MADLTDLADATAGVLDALNTSTVRSVLPDLVYNASKVPVWKNGRRMLIAKGAEEPLLVRRWEAKFLA